jgi:hypothetical protein
VNDDLNPDARQLVELARKARTPGAQDKLRIAERLAVPLAAGATAGTVAATAKATGGLLSVGTKLAAVLAVSAAATGVVMTLRSQPAPPPISQPAVKPARVVAPSAPPISETSAAPERAPSAPTPPHKPTAGAPHSAKPGSELAEEAVLLHQAQAAWRAGQSAQALQLASQHAQRFPRSQLANERDVLRVLSLCKLGQTQAAKQVGARLLSKAKGSPWYQSVAESCAAK